MNWSEVASELSDPAVLVTTGLLVFAGSGVALHRWFKWRENRDEYRRADDIIKRSPNVKRIHIPGYSDDPH